jgi:hypothetical protein
VDLEQVSGEDRSELDDETSTGRRLRSKPCRGLRPWLPAKERSAAGNAVTPSLIGDEVTAVVHPPADTAAFRSIRIPQRAHIPHS